MPGRGRSSRSSAPEAALPPIGARLRAARQARRLTLREVASASGLTTGFLSRLERDEVQPSVASLVRVCEVVGLRVGALFDPPETEVVRAGQGQAINFGGSGAHEVLVTPGTQSRLQIIQASIDPGGNGGEELYTLDCDVECAYVLSGRLVVTDETGDTELVAGDAMTFPSRHPHTWRNGSQDTPCETLWILTPAP